MNNESYSHYFQNLHKNNKATKKQVAVYLDDFTLERIDKATYFFSFTRNKLIEDAIIKYLVEAEKFMNEQEEIQHSNSYAPHVDDYLPADTMTAADRVELHSDVIITNLIEKVICVNSVNDLMELYEKQDMCIDDRREAHMTDKSNGVIFYALTETRVIHDTKVVSDWSKLSGESQAYYVPAHGRYIVRGGKDTLSKHGKVYKTLNGKSFNPTLEVPIAAAKLAVIQ